MSRPDKEREFGESLMRRVKWHLYNYEAIKKAVYNQRLDMKRKAGMPEMRSAGFVSDPTGKEAINNLTEIKYVELPDGSFVIRPEVWIESIDSVFSRFSDEYRFIATEYFFNRLSWVRIIAEYPMDKVTFYKRINQIVSLVAVAAAGNGIIRIDD